MRNHITHLTVALAVAGLAIACTGRTAQGPRSEERAQSAATRGMNQRVSLIGCVRPAPNAGEGKFILDHVTTPPPGGVPQENAASDTDMIPRGSWVRLEGVDMKSYLGKQVAIMGDMVDAGEANGDAPKVAVETVQAKADSCSEK